MSPDKLLYMAKQIATFFAAHAGATERTLAAIPKLLAATSR